LAIVISDKNLVRDGLKIVIRTCFGMGQKYKKESSMSRKIDHKMWENPPRLLGCQPGTKFVRLSQDRRRKVLGLRSGSSTPPADRPTAHHPNNIHGPIRSRRNPSGIPDQNKLPDDSLGSLIMI